MAEIASTTSAGSTSSSQAASNTLLGSYDLFLTLLTTQIQNQDPLDPLDSSEYTNQLVQYSTVEQSIQTNEYLEQLVATMSTNQATSYVSYLGTEVTAYGETTMLEDGVAKWSFKVDEAASGTVTITNAAGAVVYTDDIEVASGSGAFLWDGVGDSGTNFGDGAYTISFDLEDAAGNSENVRTEISGTVNKVDFSGATPSLTVGDIRVPVSSVLTVAG